MNIGGIPSNFANAVSPVNPLGRQPVGEETPDDRNTPLAPVEASSDSARTINRRGPDDKPNETEERERLRSAQEVEEPEDGDAPTIKAPDVNEGNAEEQRRLLQEQQELQELVRRDREVRQHERAHVAAGGQYVGPPQYQYEQGPNGVNYAVSGEVSIRNGAVEGDPEATIDKAKAIINAALAPADPSDQDRRVAAQAANLLRDAQQELLAQKREQEELKTQKAQEAREADQAAREKEVEEDDESPEDENQAQSASERFEQLNGRNTELNQRLIDIGATENRGVDPGALIDQNV